MGIDLDKTPAYFRDLVLSAMGAPDPKLEVHPPPKSGYGTERAEQSSFANWLLFQRSNGRRFPFCWHSTKQRSTASPGTPDFWVGVNGTGVWLEFKRDYSCDLTKEQEEFRLECQEQHIPFHVVYSAFDAIKIIEELDRVI